MPLEQQPLQGTECNVFADRWWIHRHGGRPGVSWMSHRFQIIYEVVNEFKFKKAPTNSKIYWTRLGVGFDSKSNQLNRGHLISTLASASSLSRFTMQLLDGECMIPFWMHDFHPKKKTKKTPILDYAAKLSILYSFLVGSLFFGWSFNPWWKVHGFSWREKTWSFEDGGVLSPRTRWNENS